MWMFFATVCSDMQGGHGLASRYATWNSLWASARTSPPAPTTCRVDGAVSADAFTLQ
jgi:hypothetical protein